MTLIYSDQTLTLAADYGMAVLDRDKAFAALLAADTREEAAQAISDHIDATARASRLFAELQVAADRDARTAGDSISN